MIFSLRDCSEELGPDFENILKLNDLPSDCGADKKKKSSRIVGWGLRKFSTIVCEKVEAKGRTTYSEVADEILEDMKKEGNINGQQYEFDEKNIRRRVYDAFNVLLAIHVIAKEQKEVKWIGFPTTKSELTQGSEEDRMDVVTRIQKKTNLLRELENRYVDLRNLISRNQKLSESGCISEGVAVPFLLIKTSPKATVEIEISEDMRFVHFDFNGAPFTFHDDASVLKAIRFQRAGRTESPTQISLDGSNLMSH